MAPTDSTHQDLRDERLGTYFAYQSGIALIAFLFPFAFLISSFLIDDRTDFQGSISAYYWTCDLERNLFVAVLSIVGVFLILYKGYTTQEHLILTAAGVAVLFVAFIPTDKTANDQFVVLSSDQPSNVPAEASDDDSAESGTNTPEDDKPLKIPYHQIFAAIFFGCIAYVCIRVSKTTLHGHPRSAALQRRYKQCSIMMIFALSLLPLKYILPLLPDAFPKFITDFHAIFWVEAFAIWSFSAYWYLKVRELDANLSKWPGGGDLKDAPRNLARALASRNLTMQNANQNKIV